MDDEEDERTRKSCKRKKTHRDKTFTKEERTERHRPEPNIVGFYLPFLGDFFVSLHRFATPLINGRVHIDIYYNGIIITRRSWLCALYCVGRSGAFHCSAGTCSR